MKGEPRGVPLAFRQRSVFKIVPEVQGTKPDEIYELIESLFPVDQDEPVHLEILGNPGRPGWGLCQHAEDQVSTGSAGEAQ